jgi:hypothetical protein
MQPQTPAQPPSVAPHTIAEFISMSQARSGFCFFVQEPRNLPPALQLSLPRPNRCKRIASVVLLCLFWKEGQESHSVDPYLTLFKLAERLYLHIQAHGRWYDAEYGRKCTRDLPSVES